MEKLEKQRVVIVNEGSWGLAEKNRKNYDDGVKLYFDILSQAERKDPGTKKMEKIGNVQVVKSTTEALRILKTGIGVGCLIFNSRSMIPEARQIKKLYPETKVIVLTGLIPDDEIVILNKLWVTGNTLETVVF